MRKNITIKDIARKLNMSFSTVSKALNNDSSIGDITKERVRQLARELNYQPNVAARNFKHQRTSTIGIIIPDLLDQFYVMALNGIEEAARQQQYNFIFAQSHDDCNR